MSKTSHAIHAALTAHHRPPAANLSAPAERLLVDAREGAAILDVCLRQFHALRPQLPAPVVLGARSVRWRVAELRAWVSVLPAAQTLPEPAQLKAGKAARRGTAGGLKADCGSTDDEGRAGQQVGRRATPSRNGSRIT